MNPSTDFVPAAFSTARTYRGLRITQVAEEAGVSRQLVNQIESGKARPYREAVMAIAAVLDFPPTFFRRPPALPSPEVLHFRKKARASGLAVERARSTAYLFGVVGGELLSRARLQFPRLPLANDLSPDGIEAAAVRVRAAAKIDQDVPIGNAVTFCEALGCPVGNFDAPHVAVDGFSWWGLGPFAMLNRAPWSRRRLSVMHELGHLVLHHGDHGVEEKEREAQAFRFAGAVLAPRGAFWREFPRPMGRYINWAALFDFKARWGMSLPAIVRRAFELDLLNPAQYRTANLHIRSNGWARREPGELEPEEPTLLAKIARNLLVHGTLGDARRGTDVSRHDFDLLSGFVTDEEASSGVTYLPPRPPNGEC